MGFNSGFKGLKFKVSNPVCKSFKVCLTLKEKYKLGVFKSSVLRTIFESRRGEVNGGRRK